jgi:hypothetical protein
MRELPLGNVKTGRRIFISLRLVQIGGRFEVGIVIIAVNGAGDPKVRADCEVSE